jgi:iron(III) transport system ATP-binding protein
MLKVENISFGYTEVPILESVSFEAKAGEHISIVGESGSGKTTLLKLLYGVYDLNQGSISWKDTSILGPKFNLVVGTEFMKYVSQEFDLVPYFTVEETVGKHLSNFYLKKKAKRIQELLEVVDLKDYRKTKITNLSGGQKQRVSIATALAKEPEIILLDEPFSHIDNFQKHHLRRNLFNYFKANDITCIVATHDKEDVLGYADKVLVLDNAKIAAQNTPEQLYKNPKSPLVASFFSEYNLIDGKVIYANQLKIVEKSCLEVEVVQSYFKGSHFLIQTKRGKQTILFENNNEMKPGESVFLQIVKK